MDYIVGDTVSALVTALTKARNGKQVALYLPESGAGGGFAGLEMRGRTLDFGIRALEISFDVPEKEATRPLESFDPEFSDHKDYIRHIREFITEVAQEELVRIAEPQLFRGGKKVQCILFSPDLSVLRILFSPQEQAIIAREAQQLADHPAKTSFGRKYLTEGMAFFRGMRLEEMLQTSHGMYMHDAIYAPLANKMLNSPRYPEGICAVPAEFYRRFWFKVFYPENIAQACSGGPALKMYRPFYYPKTGGFKGFMNKLAQLATTHPNVQLTTYKKLTRIAAEGAEAVVTFEGAPELRVPQERLTICVSPALLFKATGIAYEQTSIEWGVAWVEADKKDVLEVPSILTIVDPDIAAFRISSGGTTPETGKILFTVEFANTDCSASWAESARDALEKTGLIRKGSTLEGIHHFRGKTLPDYHFHMVESYEKAKTEFATRGFDKVTFTGGAHSLHFDTFNDHILQGLYYGSR